VFQDEVDAVSRDYEELLQGKIDRSRGLRDSIQASYDLLMSNAENGPDFQMVTVLVLDIFFYQMQLLLFIFDKNEMWRNWA